jgi:putative oxidoreductase
MASLPKETISSHGANNHRVDRILFRLTHSARVLFGLMFFANGLNWWWKILPYPSMHDHANHALSHTPPFVQAMLDTGFMFDFVRIVEVTAGTGLLLNCWTPFLLVFVFPLSVGIWAVDVFLIASSVRASVMGWAVFSLNGFLLVSYLDCYVPMLTRTVVPGLFWRRRRRQTQE